MHNMKNSCNLLNNVASCELDTLMTQNCNSACNGNELIFFQKLCSPLFIDAKYVSSPESLHTGKCSIFLEPTLRICTNI